MLSKRTEGVLMEETSRKRARRPASWKQPTPDRFSLGVSNTARELDRRRLFGVNPNSRWSQGGAIRALSSHSQGSVVSMEGSPRSFEKFVGIDMAESPVFFSQDETPKEPVLLAGNPDVLIIKWFEMLTRGHNDPSTISSVHSAFSSSRLDRGPTSQPTIAI